ncbi:MAG: rhodanese-like domain-containing protein [Winogradskyella sp.]|uniref:rhodanese-like domain-containing protein n=1 Tax=Winogradskyella sp. TaxID=1883156 RepID=UPI0025F00610|nr:rhodanese-like domain-containing protein [Winogradskyella sp.]NRB61118.1 rhodanese-like domain-containing protein [Winogradskyella sp.]
MSLLSLLFGSSKSKSGAVEVLGKTSFKNAIASTNVQLVDVRTAKEYNGGYINNAINIDFFKSSSFTEKFNELDKDQPVYIYCRSGHRSAKAAARLEVLGFNKIYDLQGGYLNWLN